MGNTLFAAREATLGYLDSADYVELLEHLEAFLDAPPLTDNASLPARKEVTALVGKTVTLHCGPRRPSHVLLPVVPPER